MKIYCKLPADGEIKFETEPISKEKFTAVCRLLAFGLYVELTRVIAGTDDFFVILWFFALTAVLVGIWIYYGER